MSIWDNLKLVHLASNRSFLKGMNYYQENAVVSSNSLDDGVYNGQVSGSKNNVYDVIINITKPRKSSCNCPFASGRRVICKHMVALYFFNFSEQADAVQRELEDIEREEEQRYEKWEADYIKLRTKQANEIEAYVNTLNTKQLKDKLVELLLKEFDNEYPDYDEFDDEYPDYDEFDDDYDYFY